MPFFLFLGFGVVDLVFEIDGAAVGEMFLVLAAETASSRLEELSIEFFGGIGPLGSKRVRALGVSDASSGDLLNSGSGAVVWRPVHGGKLAKLDLGVISEEAW